jgi:hypothetical protein
MCIFLSRVDSSVIGGHVTGASRALQSIGIEGLIDATGDLGQGCQSGERSIETSGVDGETVERRPDTLDSTAEKLDWLADELPDLGAGCHSQALLEEHQSV